MTLLDELSLSSIDIKMMHSSFIHSLSFSKIITQLTLLDIHFLTFKSLVQLVQSFPHLITLFLEKLSIPTENLSIPTNIDFYKVNKRVALRLLDLHIIIPSIFVAILSWLISTPAIETLVEVYWDEWWCETVETANSTKQFLSFCTALQRVTFEISSTLPNVIEYININHLETLVFLGIHFTTPLLLLKQSKSLPNLLQTVSSSRLVAIWLVLTVDKEEDFDIFSSDKIEEVLKEERFRNLRLFRFTVVDDYDNFRYGTEPFTKDLYQSQFTKII